MSSETVSLQSLRALPKEMKYKIMTGNEKGYSDIINSLSYCIRVRPDLKTDCQDLYNDQEFWTYLLMENFGVSYKSLNGFLYPTPRDAYQAYSEGVNMKVMLNGQSYTVSSRIAGTLYFLSLLSEFRQLPFFGKIKVERTDATLNNQIINDWITTHDNIRKLQLRTMDTYQIFTLDWVYHDDRRSILVLESCFSVLEAKCLYRYIRNNMKDPQHRYLIFTHSITVSINDIRGVVVPVPLEYYSLLVKYLKEMKTPFIPEDEFKEVVDPSFNQCAKYKI